MSIITSLAGVSGREAKRAMRDLLLFEGRLALVSENKDVLSTVCIFRHSRTQSRSLRFADLLTKGNGGYGNENRSIYILLL